MNTAAPVEHQEDARCPRHTHKDPGEYDDLDRSKFVPFYIGLIAGFRIGREAIGSPLIASTYSWMILHGDDPDATEETLQAVLNHLKKLFGNRHAAEKANLQLVQLKYLNDSFRDYITELDRLMLLAGGIDWSDRHKITLVKNELNRRMRTAIIALQLPDDYEGWRDYLHRVAHNMDEMYRIDSINSASRGPQHPRVPRHANLAPTTPTTPIQDPNVMD
ncbi:hypothetical protein DPV78_008309 [Talaromyces pinophilus]|nr:hypothetical protein DPV78_008309 [Talaromyces pinophilus]